MISPRRSSLFVALVLAVITGGCDRTITEPAAATGRSADFDYGMAGTGVALIRQGPSLNSEAIVVGSVRMMTGTTTTLNGDAWIVRDLIVPGTPTLKLNGSASYGGTENGSGSASPAGYKITLNSHSKLGKLIQRTDPIALQSVAAPTPPSGTRNVTLSKATDPVGSWATVRNLTLNSKYGALAIPPGAYGDLKVNGESGVTLGVSGATQPSVYHFQKITLNGKAEINVVGPVIVMVAAMTDLNSDSRVGTLLHPEWFDLRTTGNQLTLNGDAILYGYVRAPSAKVTLNSSSFLLGGLEADQLTMNGEALLWLKIPTPLIPPADVFVASFDRVEGTVRSSAPNFGVVDAGSTHTYEVSVSSPANTLPAAVTCNATVTGAGLGAYELVWLTQNLSLAPGTTGVCQFTLRLPNPAEVVTIAASITSAGDPNVANNSSTGTVKVRTPIPPDVTTDLIVRSILPTTAVVAGNEVEYVAAIGAQGGTKVNPGFSCTVTSIRLSDNASAGGLVPVSLGGTVPTGADGECRFKLTALVANGSLDETYAITVTADATDALELTPADNQFTANQVVRPKTIDLVVRSIQRDNNGVLESIAAVPSGTPEVVYAASVGANAGTVTSAGFNCVVTATRVSNTLPAPVVGTLITSGTATTATDGICRFKLSQLIGNGDVDDTYRIVVTAQPTNAVETDNSNNTLSADQLVTVRVDISVDPITMTGGVVPGDTTTIERTKTGVYHAIIRNTSSRSAQVRCVVTVSGEPTPYPATPTSTTVFTLGTSGAAATRDCTFSITYPDLEAKQITVTAVVVSPVDGNLANNVRTATTTPVGDGKFIGVENANVNAEEITTLNADGTLRTLSGQPQKMSVNNLALFVTDQTTPIGYFKLVGSASSGGVLFSKDSMGGPVLGTNPELALDPNSCIQQTRLVPMGFVNVHTAQLTICSAPAQDSNGQEITGRQAITVSYSSSKAGGPFGSDAAVFGDSVTVDVKLSWSLANSQTVTDFAAATIRFPLQSSIDVFSDGRKLVQKTATGCFRVTSGTSTVIGGGTSCQ